MADSLGTIKYSSNEGFQKPFSERTGKMIDNEVSRIIEEQYKICYELLSERK